MLIKAGKRFEILNKDKLPERHSKENDRTKHFYVYVVRHDQGKELVILTEFNIMEPRLGIKEIKLVKPKDLIRNPKSSKNMLMYVKLDLANLRNTWDLFLQRLDHWDNLCTLIKVRLLQILNYMSDFFDYMVVWNIKARIDTFIKYFIRDKTVYDFHRAFLIVDPMLLNNVAQFLAKHIKETQSDLGYTIEITDKKAWKSVQMVIYYYHQNVAVPFELQIITPQVLACEYFQKSHTSYEIERLSFDERSRSIWDFLYPHIESIEIKKLVQQKYHFEK